MTRIAISRTPAYSLTPKGLHAIGLHQGVPAADGPGHVDPRRCRGSSWWTRTLRPPCDDDAVRGERARPADATTVTACQSPAR